MTKTRKARRGLLFSLLTLAVALMVTATSTYAWFVVNREVTASNMQVTVTADTTYLVIKKSDSVPADTAALGTATSENMGGAGQTVLPVRYNQTATPTSPNTKWEIQGGSDYDDGTATGTAQVLTESEVEPASSTAYRYYSHYTFYVGLTPTSLVPATNLRVSTLTATANSSTNNADFYLPAVSAVVICSQGSTVLGTNDYEDITTIGTGSRPALADTATYAHLSPTVALNQVYTIDVYLYINGDNPIVTSENAAKLGGFTVEMHLTIV